MTCTDIREAVLQLARGQVEVVKLPLELGRATQRWAHTYAERAGLTIQTRTEQGNLILERKGKPRWTWLDQGEVETVQRLTHYFLVLKRINVFGGAEAQRVESLDKKLRGER